MGRAPWPSHYSDGRTPRGNLWSLFGNLVIVILVMVMGIHAPFLFMAIPCLPPIPPPPPRHLPIPRQYGCSVRLEIGSDLSVVLAMTEAICQSSLRHAPSLPGGGPPPATASSPPSSSCRPAPLPPFPPFLLQGRAYRCSSALLPPRPTEARPPIARARSRWDNPAGQAARAILQAKGGRLKLPRISLRDEAPARDFLPIQA